MADPFRLVVVGGGVAGMEVATALGAKLGRGGRAAVTLVDRSFAHVWKPMLHGFAAGTAVSERDRISFVAQGGRNHFRFVPGALRTVDRVARRIAVDAIIDRDGRAVLPERHVDYDALVVAIGSRANDFGTPGVAAHCHFLDDLAEADAFNQRFRRAMLHAIGTGAPVTVAIVGGGATGVELAAELKRALDLVASFASGVGRIGLQVSLLESGDRILAAFPQEVSAHADAALRALGIDVRTGAKVVSADERGFALADGSRVDAGLLVWAAGVKAPGAMAAFEGLQRAKGGQLMVRPTLQAEGDDRILALGDCARVAGAQVPPTAQAASQQASHLVRHLPAWIEGGALPDFRYRDRGMIVSLGDFNGWGTLGRVTFGGGRLRGLAARLGHEVLYRQHQFGISGVGRGVVGLAADGLDRLISPGVRLD